MYEVNGYKVRFRHYRYDIAVDTLVEWMKHGGISASTIDACVEDIYSCMEHPINAPSLHGGKTECYIIDPVTGRVIADGIALCSWRDNFCRKIGRDISFGRAVKRLEEMRTQNDTSCGGAE